MSPCRGVSGAILNVISGIFNSDIKHQLASQAQSQLRSAIQGAGAQALATLVLDFPITDGFALLRFDPMYAQLVSVGAWGNVHPTPWPLVP